MFKTITSVGKDLPFAVGESIVPIRPAADLPPLFLFHTLSGSIFNYSDFARCLDKKFSIYGVEAAGLDGQKQPFTCLEAMARQYAGQFRDLLDRGQSPVAFAGFSFGGNVALETATQLLAMERKVSAVILLDSYTTDPGSICPKPTDVEIFQLFVKDVETNLGRKITIQAKDLLNVGHYQQCILLEESLGPEFAGLMSPLLRVYKSNIRALAQHTLKDYGGKVVYFHATASHYGNMDRVRLFSAKLPNLLVKDIAADHFKMLGRPWVETIASTIADVLADDLPCWTSGKESGRKQDGNT